MLDLKDMSAYDLRSFVEIMKVYDVYAENVKKFTAYSQDCDLMLLKVFEAMIVLMEDQADYSNNKARIDFIHKRICNIFEEIETKKVFE